jgi:hypothetical protein
VLRSLLAVFVVLFTAFAAGLPAWADDTDELAYVSLPPLVINQSSEQTVVKVTLIVPRERRAEAEKLKPALADAFQEQLAQQARSSANMMQGRMLDLWHIKVSLLTAAEKNAPPGLIKDIRLDVTQGRT